MAFAVPALRTVLAPLLHGSPVGGFHIGIGSLTYDINSWAEHPRAAKKTLVLPLMTPFPAPPTCARSTPWLPLATDVGWRLCALSNPYGYYRASLCSRCGLPPPPSYLPSLGAALLSALLAALRRCGTMKALTPAQLTHTRRSPRLLRHTFLSFHLHPRVLPDHRFSTTSA